MDTPSRKPTTTTVLELNRDHAGKICDLQGGQASVDVDHGSLRDSSVNPHTLYRVWLL
jgi:hypothetical protein